MDYEGKIKVSLLVLLFGFISTPVWCQKSKGNSFTEDWESMSSHNEAPEWFKNAKFGIYFHWGVYSVPAFGSEWYPALMHFPGSRVNQHHVANYGEPSVFGYHDFIPQYKAENFDADEWAKLFKKAGAQFAGPVAEHHDGFSMWSSKVNPWNAKNMGPRKILSES